MPAELLEIRRMRRRDPLAIASPSDFRASTGRPADAAIALRDPRFSLYCLEESSRRALFVETPAEVDLLANPFFYQAQAAHATRVLAVPYDELEAAIEVADDPTSELILVYSVGRCGSTLVSRMLGAVDGCTSIAEPDVYTQLVQLALPPELLRRRLRMVTGAIARHPHTRSAAHLTLKFRSIAIQLADAMHASFPAAKMLFIYRDAVQTVGSGMRVFRYPGSPLGMLDIVHGVPVLRDIAAALLARHRTDLDRVFPAAAEFDSRELIRNGAAGMLAVIWISAMRRYLELRRRGLPMAALRYEDLVAEPESALRLVFEHCGLDPNQVPVAMEALHDDAQRESVLAVDRQGTYRPDRSARAAIDKVLGRTSSIGGPGLVAPGTLQPG